MTALPFIEKKGRCPTKKWKEGERDYVFDRMISYGNYFRPIPQIKPLSIFWPRRFGFTVLIPKATKFNEMFSSSQCSNSLSLAKNDLGC
jgi:hypothetical protein